MISHSLVGCALISSLLTIYVSSIAMDALEAVYFVISNAVLRKDVRFYQGGISDRDVAKIFLSSVDLIPVMHSSSILQ